MIYILNLAFTGLVISFPLLVQGLTLVDIPNDTPVSSLLSSANTLLAKGQTNDALLYYEAAINRDPHNYLSIFKRGATQLSLGRLAQAEQDFDKVLGIKPDFEGALLQRANIKTRQGDWNSARKDYAAAGRQSGDEMLALQEAQGAAVLAVDAEKQGRWEECVANAGVAIMSANRMLSLRQTRAHCRFERGEVQEGISDLMHVLQMQPGQTDPHLKIASILFYSMGDTERGTAQIRKCLHSDPDSKSCRKLHHAQKAIEKALVKVRQAFEQKQFGKAFKLLTTTEINDDDVGLITAARREADSLRRSGVIPVTAPNDLVLQLVDMACEAGLEVSSKSARACCEEALELNPNSKSGLISKARREMENENYQVAVDSLTLCNEQHPGERKVQDLLQKARVALKRSKEKDYYKILEVTHDADERQIKAAYRKMTRQHHPDKALRQGVTKEDAEKKMAAINEAYEVLSDPELKARFDRGDDPNSHDNQGQGQPFQGSPFGQGRPFHFQQGSGGQHFQFQGGFPGGFPGFA